MNIDQIAERLTAEANAAANGDESVRVTSFGGKLMLWQGDGAWGIGRGDDEESARRDMLRIIEKNPQFLRAL